MSACENSILADLVCHQLTFFGELHYEDKIVIRENIDEAVRLVENTLGMVVSMPNKFNEIYSFHNILFLYRLARSIYVNNGDQSVCEKLFLLNKMLNNIDLYYKIKMPEHFLIGHGLGSVFSKATYGNYIVAFQNVTIGVQDGFYPKIGNKTIIYPGCVISGNTIIGDNCVIGAGTVLINNTAPDNSIVFRKGGNIFIKENTRCEIAKYFKI